jgi:hypothetical protein
MGVPRPAVLLGIFALSLLSATAQQAPNATSAQAIQLLQRAFSALSAGAPVQDITLTGTAHRIAGSEDDAGTAVLKALASGASRIDLSLSSGPRSEITNISASPVAGSWSSPDGISHPIAYHNLLLVDSAWFFPVFAISRGLGTGHAASYIGQETRNGQTVHHVTIAQTPAFESPKGAPSLAHLSQIDFYLDAITLLPASASFNVHPDTDAGVDIPVEVRFSDYRNINGVQVPFHVQKFLRGVSFLDFQFTSAALNTGLSATEFAVSAQ